jgi:hypothetical protein
VSPLHHWLPEHGIGWFVRVRLSARRKRRHCAHGIENHSYWQQVARSYKRRRCEMPPSRRKILRATAFARPYAAGDGNTQRRYRALGLAIGRSTTIQTRAAAMNLLRKSAADQPTALVSAPSSARPRNRNLCMSPTPSIGAPREISCWSTRRHSRRRPKPSRRHRFSNECRARCRALCISPSTPCSPTTIPTTTLATATHRCRRSHQVR